MKYIIKNLSGILPIIFTALLLAACGASSSDPPPDVNDPPIANAGPDQTVQQGDLVTLDGTGSTDPDNDTLNYYWWFRSCPGRCPALSSANVASPDFRAREAGDYVLRLSVDDGTTSAPYDEVRITAAPVLPDNPSMFAMEWQYGLYGLDIGESGISVFDLDADGQLEIVTAADDAGFSDNVFWYAVRGDGSGGYEQVWVSERYSSSIARILATDADGNGTGEIYVGLEDGTVHIYDGQTYAETASFQTGGDLLAMDVADADGDGNGEIVISDGVNLYIYSATTQALEWTGETYGGTDLAVGNVDSDPSPEIVITTDGEHGYVVDGASHALEWDYINGFGSRVRLGDTDADGMEEIVGVTFWHQVITVFDADIKTPTWEIVPEYGVDALDVFDLDGDGDSEIFYGDNGPGSIHCHDGETGLEVWTLGPMEYGFTNITHGDLDNDGVIEIIWASSWRPDYLLVADTATKQIEWQNVHLDGPLSAMDAGDVDDDGQDEIVMVSFESNGGYDAGKIHIFNGATHTLEWSAPLGTFYWEGVRSVKIGDVDDDGRTEFIIATDSPNGAVIQTYDGATHALEKQSNAYDGWYFTTLEIGDVDNDGNTEIVAGQAIGSSAATGVNIVVFDGATLAEEWRSSSLGPDWSEVTDIELADTDQDGNIEIITTYNDNRVYAWDGVTHHLDWLSDPAASSLDTFDIDGDGSVEILVGKTDGTIDVFNGTDFSFAYTLDLPPLTQKIVGLHLDDVDQDGTVDWLISSGGRLSVFDGATMDFKWQSPDFGESLALYNHLVTKDIDNDGRKEIVFGANFALYQFE